MTSHTPTALIAPVQWMVDLLHPVLLFFHDTAGAGWGMAIVLLTVLVRALLAPLMVRQFRSMQAMTRLAPQLKAVRDEHKGDKQRQQQAIMQFYADHKVNPFASCLPLLAQVPFFIGLYWLLESDLRNDICGQTERACGAVEGFSSGAERFLFIPDLTAVPTGTVLAALVVLYVGSQLLSSVLMPSTAERTQRLIMYGLPFVFVFVVIHFPAGLIVYWITTNLWTVGQGYALRKRLGPISAPAGVPALSGIVAPATAGPGRPPPARPRKKKRSGKRR